MSNPHSTEEPSALTDHLAAYLGAWPPAAPLDVVGSQRRLEPAWDGALVPAVAVASPRGIVVSVPPAAAEGLQLCRPDPRYDARFGDALAAAVGPPGRASPWLVLRWTSEPARLAPAGRWVDPSHPALPEWLRPFPPPVLATLEDGVFLAGLGIKPHTRWGQELAVGTEEDARGRGLARRLVAQAGREVLTHGAVPLYVHHPDNLPSARAADGAGFWDRGWRMLVVSAPPDPAP